jgi:hypothetical protein
VEEEVLDDTANDEADRLPKDARKDGDAADDDDDDDDAEGDSDDDDDDRMEVVAMHRTTADAVGGVVEDENATEAEDSSLLLLLLLRPAAASNRPTAGVACHMICVVDLFDIKGQLLRTGAVDKSSRKKLSAGRDGTGRAANGVFLIAALNVIRRA